MTDHPSVLLLTPTSSRAHSPLSPFRRTQMPLLGLGYLAATLDRAGIPVRVEEVTPDPPGLEALDRRLRRGRPTLIGVQVLTAVNAACRRIVEVSRRAAPDARLVVGGPHMAVDPDGLLGPGLADVAVLGEGEATIVELATGQPLPTVAGTRFVVDGSIRTTAARPLLEDLDTLPHPARALLPTYRPSPGVVRRRPANTMLCSRGCPMRCAFCTPAPGGVYNQRLRAADACLEELDRLVRHDGVREVAFYDDLFFLGSQAHIEALCEGVLRRGLDVTWWCQLHCAFVRPSTLRLMARAGCYRVHYGVESGDARMLEELGKRFSLARVERVLRWTREAGMLSAASFMLGNLGDTRASVRRTVRFAARCSADYVIFLLSQPLPGSPMFDRARREGLVRTDDWAQYDGSQPTIRVPGLDDAFLMRSARDGWLAAYRRPRRLARLAAGALRGGMVQENVHASGHLVGELLRSAIRKPEKPRSHRAPGGTLWRG